MQCNIIKRVSIGAIITVMFLIMTITFAYAYGSGGNDRERAEKKAAALANIGPAGSIDAFGSEADAKRIERELADANKRSKKLKSELQDLRDKLRNAAKRIKEGDDSMAAEEEYFNTWKKAINKQYAAKKAEGDRLVALKNAKLLKEGDGPLDPDDEKKIRDFAKSQADKTYIANQLKFADSVMQYGDEAMDEGDARDRQIMRWTIVKYASMAGSAGLGGVAIVVKAGQLGIAALSAAEATKLLTIAAALDVGGAGVGAAADSHYSGKSGAESFIRGLSAAGVQALAGKILGKVPESATAARNYLVEFTKSASVDQLQSALQNIPDNLKKKGGSSPPSSAPNYDPPVYKQQHSM